MQHLEDFARQRLGRAVNRPINKHPDIQLLAQMACYVARIGYAPTGELTSRNTCFLVVMDYVRKELWPLTDSVPARLKARTVFLGGGRFKDGSWRRWVSDLHGPILAERFVEGAAPRRAKWHDKRAKALQGAADKHLKNVIVEVEKLTSDNPANASLLRALNQLHAEVI